MLYHHIHTLFYNVIPIGLILFINISVLIGLRKRSNESVADFGRSRQVSVTRTQSHSSLHRNSSIKDQPAPQPQPQPQPQPAQQRDSKQRARLSSSVNFTGTGSSPLQSIDFSVKRSKRESQLLHINEIFLQNSDVSCMSVWFVVCTDSQLRTTNLLSYLAEWTSSTTDHVKQLNLNTLFNANNNLDYEELYNNIPKKLLGTKISLPQINIYYVFILYGCVDMLNFSLFLFYQFYSCRLLAIDFRKFLTGYSLFRLFLKPNNNMMMTGGSRNRLNSLSSTKNYSQRRASKI